MGTLAGVLVHPRPARPSPRRLADLAGSLGLPVPSGGNQTVVTGVTLDSRAVRPGDLYAALAGANVHGAQFVGQAVQAGASAVLTDPRGEPAAAGSGVPVLVVEDPRARLGEISVSVYGETGIAILGITGTNGKTTVAYLLEAGLASGGLVTGLIGTVETRIAGVAVPSVRTTPEAPDLHALLAVMAERGVQAMAMEVSSHALAQHRVDGTRFTVGAFTNLSQDHLDFHGDMEGYFQAKALLFDGRCEHEVVNVDDEYGRRLVGPATITVSAKGDPRADWRAVDVVAEARGGSRFIVAGPGGQSFPAGVLLPGRFNVANALLALAVLAAAGVDPVRAAAGIARTTVPGRLEAVTAGQPFTALVDYAHTPEAVSTLLAALRPDTEGRLIVVLGCGGDRDTGKRALMGAAAARGADLLVVTDDNPRSEDPAAIRRAMLRGVDDVGVDRRAEVLEIGGRREAIAAAVAAAGPGDTVVVTGKGHEQGQEANGVVLPFDDRRVLAESIGVLVP
ncbi:MAG: UDP-N-acetylmuramoyl-L-alanyl-D-glutamate--2,6-diaminopimelate ligase [Geodermatophilaceae bacterium]|nr:UDP-N-acetylmuramoyl-L-alanyl-D-glutamate--2,6-diaminopimelate ligase [Geodermatophilaceae bacterium]